MSYLLAWLMAVWVCTYIKSIELHSLRFVHVIRYKLCLSKKNNNNKENKSNIYPDFPIKIIFQGKQRLNEEEFFIQKLQLINATGTKALEIHHFAIPNERVVDLKSARQWLFKPLQPWLSNSSVRQTHLVEWLILCISFDWPRGAQISDQTSLWVFQRGDFGDG